MKICVFGAGAIGGHLAARLARGGAEVSVVARGAHLAAMAERGITVRTPQETFTARVRASADPAALGPQDAVISTLKAPSLPALAAGIGPLLGPDTTVAFVMNGVPWWYFLGGYAGPLAGTRLPAIDPDGAVERAVGLPRTLGGVVYSACTVVEPGVIEAANPHNRVLLGAPDGSESDRARRLAGALDAGGVEGTVSTDIRKEVWQKWLGNISNGPLCLLSRRGVADSYADPAVRDAAVALMHEGVALARALEAPVVANVAARLKVSAAMHHKPSILQDLERGRPMEIDALFTVPQDLARQLGVPMPTLALLAALCRQAAQAAGLYAG